MASQAADYCGRPELLESRRENPVSVLRANYTP